ncbi:zf-TFIIB domain-containing protein [Nocardioides sp. zg-1308]|uniref:TFIIB-type zinc ribbon-containing protein n=1 Tax=Nocardioides sp. zg-1308 TaxID=2736253 RepID=UPI00155578B7|nr:zf-TFIIB domain-containing protein [Nocardioides sp. zg-1308]NPD06202.1 zf-TFIIB domain-containing protein [Nocardioides sp. zg-1308]
MESMTCPRCGVEMQERDLGQAAVRQCPEGHGVFLDRADLGLLVEAETDWHRNAGQHTAPMPRITADMTAPPAAGKVSRAWVETLFN